MATAPAPFFCFKCNKYLHRDHVQNFLCRFCNTGFIEEITPGVNNLTDEMPSRPSSPAENNTGIPLNQILGVVMGPNGIGIGTRVSPPTQRRGAAPTTTAAGGGANRPTSASEFIQSTLMPAFLQAMAGEGAAHNARARPRNNSFTMGEERQFAGDDEPQTPEAENGAGGGFIQNLLRNLIPGNTAIRIQFGGSEGGFGGINLGDFATDGNFDEIVTQILNQFDPNASQARITEEDLQHLPRIKVSQQHVDNEAQCTTCMDTFNFGEDVAELTCHHIFHPDCIIPWLRSHNTCPICRQEVNPANWASQNPANPLPPEPKNGIRDDDELD